MSEERSDPLKRYQRRQTPPLTIEQLAHFETPKSWTEILAITPRLSSVRWRTAIVQADAYGGSGLLTWLRVVDPAARGSRARRGGWALTEKGRELVARARTP